MSVTSKGALVKTTRIGEFTWRQKFLNTLADGLPFLFGNLRSENPAVSVEYTRDGIPATQAEIDRFEEVNGVFPPLNDARNVGRVMTVHYSPQGIQAKMKDGGSLPESWEKYTTVQPYEHAPSAHTGSGYCCTNSDSSCSTAGSPSDPDKPEIDEEMFKNPDGTRRTYAPLKAEPMLK